MDRSFTIDPSCHTQLLGPIRGVRAEFLRNTPELSRAVAPPTKSRNSRKRKTTAEIQPTNRTSTTSRTSSPYMARRRTSDAACKPISRRGLLGVIMTLAISSGCTSVDHRVKPRMGFRHALTLIGSIHTQKELISAFGPPSGIVVFNPHDVSDPAFNHAPIADWTTTNVFLPPTLYDTLPTRTTMIFNRFDTGAFRVSGVLVGYADEHGNILGWSYSISLSGKFGDQAYLEDLPQPRGKD